MQGDSFLPNAAQPSAPPNVELSEGAETWLNSSFNTRNVETRRVETARLAETSLPRKSLPAKLIKDQNPSAKTKPFHTQRKATVQCVFKEIFRFLNCENHQKFRLRKNRIPMMQWRKICFTFTSLQFGVYIHFEK